MIYFTKTSRGYSHINNGIACQDYSASYHDESKTIVAACDGHGSSIYFRSDRGSKFACFALIDVFKNIQISQIDLLKNQEYLDKLKIKILFQWNTYVENDITNNPFTDEDLNNFSEDELFRINNNPSIAYGTTLNGFVIIGKYVVCVQLGDGGVFIVKDGQAFPSFEEDESNVANITCSMCQEDAFEHLNINVQKLYYLDAILICTDGLLGPYQSYENFQNSFITPMLKKIGKSKSHDVVKFIDTLAKSKGNGDDVSIGVYAKESKLISLYKK